MSGSAFDIVLDELTLARARRGDLRACEAIYRLYQGPAYSIAFRICQCPSLAQDVLQEAFINAFKRLKQFRGDAPFWGWLRRVVVNHAISTLRKQPAMATVALEDFHHTTEGDQMRVELSTDLAAAFGQLEAQDRSVVWLHDVEGYNHTEIARLFGMTESFSKTRLSRARARLRELLGQHMHPGQSSDQDPGDNVGGNVTAELSSPSGRPLSGILPYAAPVLPAQWPLAAELSPTCGRPLGAELSLDRSRASCTPRSKCIPAQKGRSHSKARSHEMADSQCGRPLAAELSGQDYRAQGRSHSKARSHNKAGSHSKARSHSRARSDSKLVTHSEFTPAFGEP